MDKYTSLMDELTKIIIRLETKISEEVEKENIVKSEIAKDEERKLEIGDHIKNIKIDLENIERFHNKSFFGIMKKVTLMLINDFKKAIKDGNYF